MKIFFWNYEKTVIEFFPTLDIIFNDSDFYGLINKQDTTLPLAESFRGRTYIRFMPELNETWQLKFVSALIYLVFLCLIFNVTGLVENFGVFEGVRVLLDLKIRGLAFYIQLLSLNKNCGDTFLDSYGVPR